MKIETITMIYSDYIKNFNNKKFRSYNLVNVHTCKITKQRIKNCNSQIINLLKDKEYTYK